MTVQIDPASFRDPQGRVFAAEGRVFRSLSAGGLAQWRSFLADPALAALVENGPIIGTRISDRDALPGDAGVLEHDRVPFLSYAPEWPFSLLKAAAIVHLDLMRVALDRGWALKDATPHNVQFRGIRPWFIDVLSFEKRTGGPWAAYAQFCDAFLNPLLIASRAGVSFRPFFLRSGAGVSAAEASTILGLGAWRSWRTLTHVRLRAGLEMSARKGGGVAVGDVAAAGFPVAAVQKLVENLRALVESLQAPSRASAWTNYTDTRAYDEAALARKKRFVEKIAADTRPALCWDIGGHRGEFSELVAPHAETVVCMDRDETAVESVAARLAAAGQRNILPLVVDWANPSPALGWGAFERPGLFDRARPDLILALAFVHHLAIAENVPFDLQFDLFRKLSPRIVVEFVDRNDPMVQRLMRDKAPSYPGYTLESFKKEAAKRYRLAAEEPLTDTRRLFYFTSN